MFEQLQTWWQNSGLETQTALRDGIVVVVALLGGHLVARLLTRALRARNFDAALRMPPSTLQNKEAEHRFTPTFFAGLLVRLTIWTAAACWLLREHGKADLADSLRLIINRSWGLASLLVTALAVGSLLARRLIDCFPRTTAEAGSSRNGTGAARTDPAGALAAGVYVVVILLALMIAADLFDWPLTRTSAVALWEFAQHLFVAAAALLVGFFGARWTRELVSSESANSMEKRAGQYAAMGIMAVTTIMAVAVLLSGAGVLVGLAVLAVLGFLLWLARGYLPDVTAYLRLRSQQVRQVRFDGVPWQVAELGFVSSQMGRAGQFCTMQNRVVLEAHLHGAAKPASVH
jgi:hypothetical protein